MRGLFSKRLICRSLAVLVAAILPCYPAAGNEPTSRVDENNQTAKAPATVAYVRQITVLIKSKWSRSIEHYSARNVVIPNGTVVVHLTVDRDGKTSNTRVVSNTSGDALAQISLSAISDIQLPVMPAEAISELGGKRVAINITFELLSASDASRKFPPR